MSTTSSRNFTTLYSGTGSVVPQGAYGNANVVSLLNEGTDGGNTVANIVATGNVTADYFIGDGSQLTNITAANISGNVNFANTAGTAQFVTANAQANITSVGTLTSVSVTGNVVGGNLITAGVVSAASVSASGNITGGNLLSPGSITATGNVTAANFFGNVFGNIVGNVDAAGSDTQIQFNTGNLLDASANLTFDKSTSTLKVTGNATYPTAGVEIYNNGITGNILFGNLIITNLYKVGNGGVSYGRVVIDTTELQVGQDNAALGTNAAIRAIRNQALQLTTTNAGAPSIYVGKYVANSATYTGNIDVQSSNVGGYGGTGNINLSGNVYVGRNAQGADTANAKANLIVTDSVYINQDLSVAGNISIPNLSTTGNITAGNFITAGNLYGNVVASSISGQGTANLDIIQSGNSLGATTLNLAANIVVTGGSASSVITSAPGSNLQLTTNQGGSSGQPRLFVDQYDPGVQAGNVDVRTGGGAISGGFAANATVNISGNVRIGPYAPGVAPASTGINLEVAGAVTAAGNINGANLVASANLTSTQQTVVGTANTGTTGNIVMSGKNIATDMAFLPDGGNAATAVNGRIVVGTGWNGNISHSAVQNRLLVQDAVVRGNTTTNTQFFASDPIVSLTGNVTNNSFRVQGIGSRVRIGGGPAGNALSGAFGVGSVGTVAALQPNIDVGNISPYNLGNTTVSQATLNGGFILPATGSTVNNAYGMIPGLNAGGGNIVNYIGFASQLQGMSSGSVTGNVYGVYHGSNATINTTGIGTNNIVRSAPGYYAFYNADAVAQVQLGSLRSYNEFRYDTATTGNITLDKNNAQVQYLAPTANVTIDAYANMVTTLSDSVNTDQQIDTLTVLVQQGATPYTVSLPTGATYQYAGNISTVPAVANSRSILTVVAANVAGTVNYFTTVQSDQTVQEPAAGANTQVQFNDSGVLGATAGLTFDKTSNAMVVAGNITGGNLRTAGAVSATGNITGGNVIVPINGKYYGDFTTGTTAGRTVFQTTATGTSAATSLTAVPGPNHITSNTAFSSQINLFASGTDLGNSAFGRMQMFGNRLNFEVLAAGSGPVGNMRFAAGSGQMVFLNTGNVGIGNANPNHSFSTNETFIAGNISVTGNVITTSFLKAHSYTAAALNAITGSIGQMAAVSDSAGGGNPNGMLAFWDTTNARWSYIHDNTAV